MKKLQLCSLHENYNKGVVSTGWDNFELPQTVGSSITLIDIAEFNENENTITLQMILSIRWYATTMTLESKQDKYVSNQLYLKFVLLLHVMILEYLNGINLMRMIRKKSGVQLYK